MRKALTAAAAVALLATVVFASTATAAVTVTSRSGSVMYTDLKNGYDSVYLAFAVTSDAVVPDVWAVLTTSGTNIVNVGTGVHRLKELTSVMPDGTPMFGYGLDPAGVVSPDVQTGFFLVQASAEDTAGGTLTITVYDGEPGGGGTALGSQDFVFTVESTIQANANKVNAVVTLPATPEVGKVGTVEVTGCTGTVNNPILYFSPVSAATWPEDTFEFMDTKIAIDNYAQPIYHDTLKIPEADVLTTDNCYTATYTFVINGPATANTSPVGYIGSGTQVKHTTYTTGTFEVIICEPFTFDPAAATLTGGTTGVAYSASGSVTGGTAPYTMDVTWNTPATKPDWVTLNTSTDGTWSLSGTPPTDTGAGSYQFTFDVTDDNGCISSMTYSFNIQQAACDPITVGPAPPLADATAGVDYGTVTFTATGGSGSYTWAISPAAPPGMTWNGTNHTLSGTPNHSGSYPFTVSVTDDESNPPDCPGSQAYVLVVNCPTLVWVSPATLPDGQVGVPYNSGDFDVDSGATGVVHFTFMTNSSPGLPSGLTFDGTKITGTPTASGAFTIEVTAEDDAGCSPSTKSFNIYICPVVTITTAATLPSAIAGAAYSTTLAVTPAGSYQWESADLPAWLSLNINTGQLTGTPTVTGPYTFTVTATDTNGCGDSKTFSLSVGCPSITVGPASIPAGTNGVLYPTQTFYATGGIAPHTFQFSGSLPTGMAWTEATKSIGGTPTQEGTFNFTITTTDDNGCQAYTEYTLRIDPAVVAPIPTLGLGGLALLVLLLAGAAIFLLRRS